MIRRAMAAEIRILDRGELRELQAAAKERVEKLEKFEQNLSKSELSTAASDVRATLRIWQGVDGESGLLERIADQMSLYEPAFSDGGREPDGQLDILDGVDRSPVEEAPTPVVSYDALKAALILSGLSARADDEAFDRLDVLVPEERRSVFLGRAPTELLRSMSAIDASVLYEIVLDRLLGVGEESDEEDQEILRKLATATAQHGATLAPYYEPFPIGETDDEDISLDIEDRATLHYNEDTWSVLTLTHLQRIVQLYEAPRIANILTSVVSERAARGIQADDLLNLPFDELGAVLVWALYTHLAANDNDVDVPPKPAVLEELEAKWEAADPPEYQPSAAEKLQEEILTHHAVSSDLFKDTVRQASHWAVERALEIIHGLEGNATREKLLRKRLEEIESSMATVPAAPAKGDGADDSEDEWDQGPEAFRPVAEEQQEEPGPFAAAQAEAFAAVNTWEEYRAYCYRYGIRVRRVDFEALEDERRLAPSEQAVPAGSIDDSDDDLLDDDIPF